jgi:hypothetical protein
MARGIQNGATKRMFADAEKIKKLYWDEKLSHREIGSLYGCNRSLVNRYAERLGINGVVTSSRMIGEKSPNHKGGTLIGASGYLLLRVPKKESVSCTKFVHKMIAEKALGRELKRGECVHHIDGNKLNNKNNNLLICSWLYHSYLTKKMSTMYLQEHYGRTRFDDLYQKEHFGKGQEVHFE